jgi:hypothetical protein
MRSISKQFLPATMLTVILCSAPALWADEKAASAANARDASVTEFRGRPPFKRQRVSADEFADLARFEELPATRQAGARLRLVDFRSRPPYKRQRISADEVAELARFEETTAAAQVQQTRRGPPGKPTARR